MRVGFEVLCVFALLACGCGDDESPSDQLQGNWVSEIEDGFECYSVLTFDADAFEMKEVCELDDGDVAAAVSGGKFTATDSTINVEWEYSSCEDPELPDSLRYSFSGERLRMISDSGARLYEAVEDNGGGGTSSVVFGCFDADGYFEERDIEQL